MATAVVLIVLAGAVGLVIGKLVRDKKAGKSFHCGGDCNHCGGNCRTR